jgi:GNAT superfamily N-acetyltransferase
MYRTWDAYEVVGLFQSDTEFCLVAEAEDRLVGFLLGTTIIKSRSAWKYGYLIWLGVHPDAQQHGVAEKLFLKFKEIMIDHGIRMLIVDTSAENLPALHFFRKQGFGHPQQHIYLTLNLQAEIHRLRKRGGNPHGARPEKPHERRPAAPSITCPEGKEHDDSAPATQAAPAADDRHLQPVGKGGRDP